MSVDRFVTLTAYRDANVSDAGRFFVLGTRSEPTEAISRIESGDVFADVNGVSASVAFGYMSASGGSYRLCRCAAGYPCSIAEAFRVTVGQLTIFGPPSSVLVPQERTCVSGQRCSLDGIVGHLLFDQGSFAILDTCGASLDSQSLSSLLLVPRTPFGGRVPTVSENGAKFALEDLVDSIVFVGVLRGCVAANFLKTTARLLGNRE